MPFPRTLALKTATVALMMALTVKTASAAGCYTMAEYEAEQGLRIHSELMVIGLTCAKMPGGAALYSKYQSFTAKNQTLITMYENALIAHFRKQGGGNPETQFHTLRTGMANKISQLAIGNVVGFCHAFTPRLDAAMNMEQEKIRRWAQQVWRDAPTSKPICTRQAAN